MRTVEQLCAGAKPPAETPAVLLQRYGDWRKMRDVEGMTSDEAAAVCEAVNRQAGAESAAAREAERKSRAAERAATKLASTAKAVVVIGANGKRGQLAMAEQRRLGAVVGIDCNASDREWEQLYSASRVIVAVSEAAVDDVLALVAKHRPDLEPEVLAPSPKPEAAETADSLSAEAPPEPEG